MRVLTIDGGGFRGLYSAHILKRIEAEFGVSFWKDFDLIAGTSTGSIVAGALAIGLSPDVICNLYVAHGKEIFEGRISALGGQRKPKYDKEPLRKALKSVFGNFLLRNAKTRLLIPATDIGNGTVHPIKSNYDPSFTRDPEVPLVDAILASCSAPLYFAPTRVDEYLLADGGLWANNPSLVALTEAMTRLSAPRESIRLLSIGTGSSKNFYEFREHETDWGFLCGWGIKQFISMLLNLQTTTATNVVSLLLDPAQLVRIDFQSDSPLPLDDPKMKDMLLTKADHDFTHASPRIRAWLDEGR